MQLFRVFNIHCSDECDDEYDERAILVLVLVLDEEQKEQQQGG